MHSIIAKISGLDLSETNIYLESVSGIVNFFSSEEEKNRFISYLCERQGIVAEDRISYGDWQTPRNLAASICFRHKELFGEPEILIEPTCGLGAFVLSSIQTFPRLTEIHAVEINQGYTTELKYRILSEALAHSWKKSLKIYIYTTDFFKFDFQEIFAKANAQSRNVGIIGNPPWVTNSMQGVNGSTNLPAKNNGYHLKGIDAITGKGNFDISEAIILSLLSKVKGCGGGISILLKNSVIRNIVMKQKQTPFYIRNLTQNRIDAKKEFNVSVDASCLMAEFGPGEAETCDVTDFYTQERISTFGWFRNSFVSDLAAYKACVEYDGECPYIWRSGLKHDCSDILELELRGNFFYNNLGEKVDIEEDLIYPLLKSSDLSKKHSCTPRKHIIVTQRFIGEDTSYIRSKFPKTYKYLCDNLNYFSKRKSSIYKGKDRFSIFGVGDYSFMPYKVVISALYKDFRFSLIEPYDSKPVQLDDTCYQIGFNTLEEARDAFKAFTSPEITNLINTLCFMDAKRVITKSLLMRLDITSLLSKSPAYTRNKICTQPSLFDRTGL